MSLVNFNCNNNYNYLINNNEVNNEYKTLIITIYVT